MTETTTPTNQYTTTAGTEAKPYVAHEPRTIERDNNGELYMMSEIGDGVFVQWSQCRKCNKRIGECKDIGGPVEPDYITRWRDARFNRELKERPDPAFELLPEVIGWLRDRGYTVTKKGEKAPTTIPVVGGDDINPDRESATDEYRELLNSRALVEDDGLDPDNQTGMDLGEGDQSSSAPVVDEGLQAALERLKNAKTERNLDVDF